MATQAPNPGERRALFRHYYGTPEPSYSAEFHHLSREERANFRSRLQDPNFSLPMGCPEEFRARWIVALDVCDLMADPEATQDATTEARGLLERVSQLQKS